MNTDPMISVPAGQVTLSDRRTQTSWTVELEPFRLAATPVTQELYARVTGTSAPENGERLPLVDVSWWDAVNFCNTLSWLEGLKPAYRLGSADITWLPSSDGYRLPTEAEWEYACRAGTTGPRYGDLDEIAWYRANSGEHIHPVGGKLANSWGFHDLLGNVWEWCWDIYDAEVYGDYRVIRGGGWCDEQWSCRASVRRRTMPTLRIEDLGFRLARSVG